MMTARILAVATLAIGHADRRPIPGRPEGRPETAPQAPTRLRNEPHRLTDLVRERGQRTDPDIRRRIAWCHIQVEQLRCRGQRTAETLLGGQEPDASAAAFKPLWSASTSTPAPEPSTPAPPRSSAASPGNSRPGSRRSRAPRLRRAARGRPGPVAGHTTEHHRAPGLRAERIQPDTHRHSRRPARHRPRRNLRGPRAADALYENADHSGARVSPAG
jgi:hypothetical protein